MAELPRHPALTLPYALTRKAYRHRDRIADNVQHRLSAEFEAGQFGVFLNVVDRLCQLINVDAVKTRFHFRSHNLHLSFR